MRTTIQLLFLACLFSIQLIHAQEPVPKWAKDSIPDGYYYGVGIGKTEQEAMQKAKDDALVNSLPIYYQESFHKGRISIDSIKIVLPSDISQRDYITQSPAICTAEGVKVYALLCFTKKKDTSYRYDDDPVFERELKIWNYAKYPATARALVPGWAQFEKGSKTKGILFISVEAALLTGAATAEGFRSSYESKVDNTYDKRYYADKADNSEYTRNALLAAAAGVYIWNVIDGLTSKGKRGCNASKNVRLNVTPFVTHQGNSGISFALNF